MNPIFQVEIQVDKSVRFSLSSLATSSAFRASLEGLSQPTRQALGLKYGHVILAHFIDQVYAPVKKWTALNKLNKGGRPTENVFQELHNSAAGDLGRGQAILLNRERIGRRCMAAIRRPSQELPPFLPKITAALHPLTDTNDYDWRRPL